MKPLIAILILLVAVFAFTQITGFYNRTAVSRPPGQPDPLPPTEFAGNPTGDALPGLPPALEASLAQARQQGMEELGKWLKQWGRQVQDPRLAWIELDYVVLLNLSNRKAAREHFEQVAARIGPGSPVYERVQKLAPAYVQPQP